MALAAIAAALCVGCVSVSSTAAYYLPYTTKTYPPKPKDAVIPILGKSPDRPYTVIGRLAFRSEMGWAFMRESMLYNARANGADAVILRSSDSTRENRWTQVPPRTDWVPVPGPVVVSNCGKKNSTYYQTSTYIPVFQPGYVRRWVAEVTAIDAEMIVFR